MSESINYALEVKPEACFPVHDGVLANPAMMQGLFTTILSKNEIEFMSLNAGEELEFTGK